MSINEEAAVTGLHPSTIYRRRVAAGAPTVKRAGRSTMGRKRRFFPELIDWSRLPSDIATELGVKEASVVAMRWRVFGSMGAVAKYIIEQEINRGR